MCHDLIIMMSLLLIKVNIIIHGCNNTHTHTHHPHIHTHTHTHNITQHTQHTCTHTHTHNTLTHIHTHMHTLNVQGMDEMLHSALRASPPDLQSQINYIIVQMNSNSTEPDDSGDEGGSEEEEDEEVSPATPCTLMLYMNHAAFSSRG